RGRQTTMAPHSHRRIVMVLEEPFALEPPYEVKGAGPLIEQARTSRRRAAEELLRELGRELESKTKLKTSKELREGSPKKELLPAIEKWKPDLVLIGSHGR